MSLVVDDSLHPYLTARCHRGTVSQAGVRLVMPIYEHVHWWYCCSALHEVHAQFDAPALWLDLQVQHLTAVLKKRSYTVMRAGACRLTCDLVTRYTGRVPLSICARGFEFSESITLGTCESIAENMFC